MNRPVACASADLLRRPVKGSMPGIWSCNVFSARWLEWRSDINSAQGKPASSKGGFWCRAAEPSSAPRPVVLARIQAKRPWSSNNINREGMHSRVRLIGESSVTIKGRAMMTGSTRERPNSLSSRAQTYRDDGELQQGAHCKCRQKHGAECMARGYHGGCQDEVHAGANAWRQPARHWGLGWVRKDWHVFTRAQNYP